MCTSSFTGKLLLGVLASIAEFEADIRRERQHEGIDRAKAAGVYEAQTDGRRSPDAISARSGARGTEIAKSSGSLVRVSTGRSAGSR